MTDHLKPIRDFLRHASDEEVLEGFFLFLDQRLSINTQVYSNAFEGYDTIEEAVMSENDPVFTHEIMTVEAGDVMFRSNPMPLDWPMIPITVDTDGSLRPMISGLVTASGIVEAEDDNASN